MTREEAIEALTSKDVSNSDVMLEALEMAINALKKEPKTGHWIEGSDIDIMGKKVYWYTCSNCNEDRGQNTNYCPNCGSRMER